ncbi:MULTISPECIES: FAD-dependent oxidoreductase [Arthrobacter]|uniref:FAD-dependent oxidoreductase n=2 Tax=Arthrobacter TaxID=1663 RepID=A0ABU9KSJ6_9MICC|nr:FAD-dependent oxidoreductase [Arthrobacter sp. YJM1]MDP5228410.1 FAD-dependent oxidoreductase [Arthrobacter sp. YJM1]
MTAPLPLARRVTGLPGRIPMTRLVALALGVLVLYSLLLDALGWTEFGMLPLLAHLGQCLAATLVGTALCALLFRLRPYWDSSLVTAGLLYFLFWPATSAREAWGVILAGLLASASKYALAWRGRHLFNPAALGAFVVSLTGLNAATWWVGSPPLLWAVIPLGLLVLYRAGQFPVALTFLALSFVTAEAVAAVRGLSVTDVPALWFAGQATVFFACFMMSEPLTLPPRRLQRVLVGAVTGVLFSLPLSLALGPVILTNAPEAVLLVGNLLAFALRPRQSATMAFLGSREVAPGVREFSFHTVAGARTAPGQYVELTLPVPGLLTARRVFSPVTAGDGVLRIATRIPASPSPAKQALLTLPVGALIQSSRAAGDFVLPSPPRPLLLAAGGIGVTPFVALTGADGAGASDTVLLYSARSLEDAAYLDELAASGARVLLRTSAPLPEDAVLPDGVEHVGTERLTAARVTELVPDAARRLGMVAGTPDFVRDLKKTLRGAGVRKVKKDSFLGY